MEKKSRFGYSGAMFLRFLAQIADNSFLEEAVHQAPPPDLGAAFAKMLLTFVLLVALLCGTYWFIKRLIQMRLQRGVGTPSIEVLEKRMISAKTMLYLVKVKDKKILLAESHLEVKRLESFQEES